MDLWIYIYIYSYMKNFLLRERAKKLKNFSKENRRNKSNRLTRNRQSDPSVTSILCSISGIWKNVRELKYFVEFERDTQNFILGGLQFYCQ